MYTSKLIRSAIFTGFVLAAAQAGAYFEVNADTPAVPGVQGPADGDYQVVADRRVAYLNQRGRRDPEVAALAGAFADSIPLENALRILLPQGWIALQKSSVPRNTVVSFRAGHTWIDNLESIGRANEIAFTIDWATKHVLVDPIPALSSQKLTASAIGVGSYIPAPAPSAPIPAPPTMSQATPQPPPAAPAPAPAVYAPKAPVAPANIAPPVAAVSTPPVAPVAASTAGIPELPPAPPAGFNTSVMITASSQVNDPMELEKFNTAMIESDQVNVTVQQAIQGALPDGWTVELRDVPPAVAGRHLDLKAPHTSRAAILSSIGTSFKLSIAPFIDSRKVIVTPAKT